MTTYAGSRIGLSRLRKSHAKVGQGGEVARGSRTGLRVGKSYAKVGRESRAGLNFANVGQG